MKEALKEAMNDAGKNAGKEVVKKSGREIDACEVACYDEPTVRRIQNALQQQDVTTMAKMFKALADETRLKIISALCEEAELCVCDVAHIIGSSTATASHHLRTLKQLGLARYRKEGKLVFYSLDDDHVSQLVRMAAAHAKEVAARG